MPALPLNSPNSLDHREREARAQDIVEVFNPQDKDYYVYWNSLPFKVAAKSKAQLPRYIAVNYIDQMTNLILIDDADRQVKAENDKRVKDLQQKPMDAKEEEAFARRFMPDARDSDRVALVKQLFVRTISRYGAGAPPLNFDIPQQVQAFDAFSIMNELENQSPTPAPAIPTPSSPSEAAVEDML